MADFLDEDFWINPVASVWPSNRCLPVWDGDPPPSWAKAKLTQISIEVISTTPPHVDEDFWQNPVQPVAASLYQKLPLGDPEEIPAATLLVAPSVEEEYWQNQVQPVAASLYRSPIYLDPEEIPAASLVPPHNQMEEEYWQNQVQPLSGSLYRSPLLGDREEVPGILLVAPAVWEDYRRNPVQPVPASLWRSPLLVADREEIPAGSLFEYFVKLTQLSIEVISSYARVEEEYWRNPVRPLPAAIYRSPIFVDADEIPAGTLFVPPMPTEDYWQNQVSPVAARLYQKLPIGDPEEIPAATLFLYLAKLTQMSIEVISGYDKQVYTGWTGTSMCVS